MQIRCASPTAILKGEKKENPKVNCLESAVQQNNRSNGNAYRSCNNNASRLCGPIIEATSTVVNTGNDILQQREQQQDTYANGTRSHAAHLEETQHLQEKVKQQHNNSKKLTFQRRPVSSLKLN